MIFSAVAIPKVSLTLLSIPRVAVVRIKRKSLWAVCISHTEGYFREVEMYGELI